MNLRSDLNQSIELTAYEVASISQSMTLNHEVGDVHEQRKVVSQTEAGRADLPLLTLFSLVALGVYALIGVVLAVLDLEDLASGFQSQVWHYAAAYFWVSLSAAMLLAAWVVIERVQMHSPL